MKKINIFNNFTKDKTAVIYVVIIFILILFAILLLVDKNSTKIGTNTSSNPTITPASTLKNISSTNYYSNVTIPSNFTSTETTLGSTDIPIYFQKITSQDGSMEINIQTIPANVKNIKNTGSSNIILPDSNLISSMTPITIIDSVSLYRENSDTKYFLADKEATRNEPQIYLSQDRNIPFTIFAQINDIKNKTTTYISPFKTSKNQSVSISAFIKYDPGIDIYNQDIKQLDVILKSLKI